MPARRGSGAGPASRVAWYLKFRLSASTCAGTVISLGHSQHGSKLYVHSDRGRAYLKFLSVLWPFSGVRFGSAVAPGGVSGAIPLCRYAFTRDGKAWNKPWSRVLCARRVGAGYHNVLALTLFAGIAFWGQAAGWCWCRIVKLMRVSAVLTTATSGSWPQPRSRRAAWPL